MNQIILMIHVLFGVGCVLASLWVFVETMNATQTNLSRIRWVSRASAACMWMAFFVGGYWYVVLYPSDKAIILKGPWRVAHNYFMETKEHFVITLLLLATYLPIAASNNLTASREARGLVQWVSGLVVVVALMAEGHGALIAMGVKEGLLARIH